MIQLYIIFMCSAAFVNFCFSTPSQLVNRHYKLVIILTCRLGWGVRRAGAVGFDCSVDACFRYKSVAVCGEILVDEPLTLAHILAFLR